MPAVGLDHELEQDRALRPVRCMRRSRVDRADSACVAFGFVMPGSPAAGSPRVPSTTAVRRARSACRAARARPCPSPRRPTDPENASARSATLTTIPSRLTLSVSRSARTSQATHPPLADGVRGPVYIARPHLRAVGPEPAAGAPARRLPAQGHAIAVVERPVRCAARPEQQLGAAPAASASRYSKRRTKSAKVARRPDGAGEEAAACRDVASVFEPIRVPVADQLEVGIRLRATRSPELPGRRRALSARMSRSMR